MHSREEREYLKQFKAYDDAVKNFNKSSRSSPFMGSDDLYLRTKMFNAHFENMPFVHFGYKGVRDQYGSVDVDDSRHQKIFLEYAYFYQHNNQFKESKDYQSHLAIIRQRYQEAQQHSNFGKMAGKLGDVINLLVDEIPDSAPKSLKYPAKGFKYLWSLRGDEIKDWLKRDPEKVIADDGANYIKLHGDNPAAMSAYMKEFPIGDEKIQKALWLQLLKDRNPNLRDAPGLTDSISKILQDHLKKQEEGRREFADELQQALGEEFKKYASQLTDSMDDLKKQFGDISKKFSQHLATLDQIHSHAKSFAEFAYRENEIKGLAACAQFVGSIAAFTQSKELTQLVKFTQGVTAIADAVNQLNKLQDTRKLSADVLTSLGITSVGPLALAGGYATVAFAIFGLMTSFIDQGPSGDQLILDYLGKLWNFIGEEFQKVHQETHKVHSDMIIGFNAVLNACQNIFDLLNETRHAVYQVGQQVQDLRGKLVIKLEQIHTEVIILKDYVEAGFPVVATERFRSNIRQLNDLKEGQELALANTHKLMRELVGDHLLKSPIIDKYNPINFFTGAFYFKPGLFQELVPNSTLLYFSPLRDLNVSFVDTNCRYEDKDCRFIQAETINRIVTDHGLSSLLGFFAAYAEKIVVDQCKSVGAIQAEAAEKKNVAYQTQVREQIKRVEQKIEEHRDQIRKENNTLQNIERDIRRLFPALKFLYEAPVQTDFTNWVAFYRDAYDRFIKPLNVQEHPRYSDALKEFVQEKLNLILKPEGQWAFDNRHPQTTAYENALKWLNDLSYQHQKIAILQLRYDVSMEEKIKLENSLNLASMYERKSLSSGLVFNTNLWILATHTYLDILFNYPQLAAHYHDQYLQDLYRIIVMGKNFIHFVDSLRNNKELFAALWRGYAFSLINIHQYYQQKWQNHLETLKESEDKERNSETCQKDEKCRDKESIIHLVNQMMINSTVVLKQEADFAKEINKEEKWHKKLTILESQKNLLCAFHQIIGANTQVMSVIQRLWGKESIRAQISQLIDQKRDIAHFTTLEVFKHLNEAYFDIVKYQSQEGIPVQDVIDYRTITDLITYLEWREKIVMLQRQSVFYEWELLSFADARQLENSLLDQSINRELLMPKNDFACLLETALTNTNMNKTQDATVFIGPTRAGKSSFIAYALGCTMEFRDVGEVDDLLIARNCPTSKIPAIGLKPISQTLFPAGYEGDGNTYVDFPGTDDTRTHEEALLGVIATQVAIKTIHSIKRIVVVISLDDIANKNAKNLAEVVSAMSKLFKNFTEHQHDMTLVVTKLQKIKDKPLHEQKNRIIKNLKEFDEAVKAGNYLGKIPDPTLAREFLSIFIQAKNYHNLILFHPLNPNARNELFKHIASRKEGFSSDAMNFVGDDHHKREFFSNIEGPLQEALKVLNQLLHYPTQKLKLENDLSGWNKEISNLEAGIAEANSKPADPAIVVPYSDDQFVNKRKESADIELEINQLLVAEKDLQNKIAAKEALTTLKPSDDIRWNEIDDYPGGRGYPRSNEKYLERDPNKGPYHSRVEYMGVLNMFGPIDHVFESTSCEASRFFYSCRICPNNPEDNQGGNPADLNKDGWVYCYFDHSKKFTTIEAEIQANYLMPFCKKMEDRGKGAQARIEIKNFEPANGKYQAIYHSPQNCYGRVVITFFKQERDMHPVKSELDALKQKLIDTGNAINENHAKRFQINELLIDMEKANQKARQDEKDREHRAVILQNKIATDRTNLITLRHEESQKQTQLAIIKAAHEETFKIYCTNLLFWKRLIELNEVIQFNFEKYTEFKDRFSEVSKQLTTPCDVKPFECDTVLTLAKECNTEKLKELLKKKPDVNILNANQESALDIAITSSYLENRDQFIIALIKEGAWVCKKQNAILIMGILHSALSSDVDLEQHYQQFSGLNGLLNSLFFEQPTNNVAGFGATGTMTSYHVMQNVLQLFSRSKPAMRSYENYYASPQTAEVNNTAALVRYDDAENYSSDSSSHAPFDTGAWDPVIRTHDVTGEAVFTYRVYQAGKEVGSASFYKHPLLCRSDAGDRHNIIATTGVLSQFNLEMHSIEDVCAALPPTTFERIITSAKQGAEHGAVRGIANVVGYTLQARHVPQVIANRIQQSIYYLSYFALRFHERLSHQQDNHWENITTAAFIAAYDTTSMWIMNAYLNWFCKSLHKIAESAHQKGWVKTSGMLKFFGDAAPYSMYAYNATQNGLLETTSSMVSGVVAQTAIEQTGKAAVKLFF